MKYTIKLLTVAITLVTILTLTGCPGPVTPDKPCTHEHTKTEVIEEATCSEDGLGKVVCVDCEEVIEEQVEIDALGHDFGEWSNWTTTREVAYDHDGEKKHTHTCTICGHAETEKVTVSRFVAGGYDGDIPAEVENPEKYRYEHNGTQVKVYVYTLTKEEELNDLGILYYSFEETDKTMELNDLLHLKPEYKDYTVAYCCYQFFPTSDSKYILTSNGRYIPWEDKLNYPIGIIIEPQTN